MIATHYRRSDGQVVEIATMNPHHVMAALAKLRAREPHRRSEIEALSSAVYNNDRTRVTGG
jgi:hypothetical protein